MTILALLLLLLTLLCCVYLCARCRCFGARGISEGSASGREILGSDYYTIPRAKLKPGAHATVLHGPFETDTEQYAVTSADHFRQASSASAAAGATAASLHGSSGLIPSGVQGASMGGHMRTEGAYDSESDADSDAGRATYDRVDASRPIARFPTRR
ncbi:hypothetical protein OSTOST_22731 [Ostertagia ostertagi]